MMESMTDIDRGYDGGQRDIDGGDDEHHAKKALLAGLIGAVVASAGYLIYSRLEDEQKDAIRQTVSKFVEDKIADVRSQLKF